MRKNEMSYPWMRLFYSDFATPKCSSHSSAPVGRLLAEAQHAASTASAEGIQIYPSSRKLGGSSGTHNANTDSEGLPQIRFDEYFQDGRRPTGIS